jgi:hypothetical protein
MSKGASPRIEASSSNLSVMFSTPNAKQGATSQKRESLLFSLETTNKCERKRDTKNYARVKSHIEDDVNLKGKQEQPDSAI